MQTQTHTHTHKLIKSKFKRPSSPAKTY